MHPRHTQLALAVLAASGALAALSAFSADVDLSKLPPPATTKGLTFEKDIKPLFETSCLRCHGAERPKGGLRLDSREASLKGGENGKAILPGDSKKSPLVHSVARIDDETAMPPKRGPGGRDGGGGPNGPGGRGGPGGFGPGMFLAPQLLSQGDKNLDKALSSSEFAALADAWFDKLDPSKTGKLTQEQFVAKLGDVLPPAQGGPGGQGGRGGRGGRDGFGPARFVGPAVFGIADANKDGSLTRAELKTTFAAWSTHWDTDKKNGLSEGELAEGLNTTLPRPNFGGPGGPGGPGGQGGPGGPAREGGPGAPGGRGPGGGGGGFGPPPPPLTPAQVGIVRAWIDQGAK